MFTPVVGLPHYRVEQLAIASGLPLARMSRQKERRMAGQAAFLQAARMCQRQGRPLPDRRDYFDDIHPRSHTPNLDAARERLEEIRGRNRSTGNSVEKASRRLWRARVDRLRADLHRDCPWLNKTSKACREREANQAELADRLSNAHHDTKWCTAAHESGHSLFTHRMGVGITSADIIEREGRRGVVKPEPYAHKSKVEKLSMLLAGSVCWHVAKTGTMPDPGVGTAFMIANGGSEDLKIIRNLLQGDCLGGKTHAEISDHVEFRQARAIVLNVIQSNWYAIDAVARQLVVHKELDGKTIEKILDSYKYN